MGTDDEKQSWLSKAMDDVENGLKKVADLVDGGVWQKTQGEASWIVTNGNPRDAIHVFYEPLADKLVEVLNRERE